ncbi:MAG: hypothetical protein IPH60_12645 [Flavobacteriales bacterium]|nr:hypothetical protein [Flavobacteriales bacterium]
MESIKVQWCAAWHELDQPIRIGLENEFILILNENGRLQFDTGFVGDGLTLSTTGRIERIEHKFLGEIEEIDTNGLSYRISTVEGDIVQVEAEETPGVIEHSTLGTDVEYDGFEFEVTIGRVKPMKWLEQE